MSQPLLQVRDLSLLYGEEKGCQDVSFDLYPGEVLGIVGESGSVATTTSLLPGGNQFMVTAHYPGDGTFGASDSAPVAVTVMP
ncbi:MAG: hypothetical protein ACRESF_09405, partial [Pseudomonas sp.]